MIPRTITIPRLVLLALAGTSTALAQTAAQREEALQACLSIESDGERLACLEAELRPDDARGGSSERASTAADSTPDSAPVSVSRPAATRAAERVRPESAPRADPEEAARQAITVVDVRRNALGHTRFETADGRILLQRSPNRGRYPDVPFEAELEAGARDTYFLSSPLGGPRVRVSLAD